MVCIVLVVMSFRASYLYPHIDTHIYTQSHIHTHTSLVVKYQLCMAFQ